MLLILLPDIVLGDREEAHDFLKDAFQPPMDAMKALNDVRARAPATVQAVAGGGGLQGILEFNTLGRRLEHCFTSSGEVMTLCDVRPRRIAPVNWLLAKASHPNPVTSHKVQSTSPFSVFELFNVPGRKSLRTY